MKVLATRQPVLNPWAGFREMEEQLNRILGGYSCENAPVVTNWAPAVDLKEAKDAYVLKADLPGLTKEDIDLSITEDVITIKGARKAEKEEKEAGYHVVERSFGTFMRSFRLPQGIDAAKVEAKFENGVLEVRLPKPEEALPKRIEVKVS